MHEGGDTPPASTIAATLTRSGQTATAFFCSRIDHEQFLAHDCRASGRLRRGQQFLLRLRERPSRRITLDGEYVPKAEHLLILSDAMELTRSQAPIGKPDCLVLPSEWSAPARYALITVLGAGRLEAPQCR